MAYTQDELKQQVAKAAVEYVKGGIIGVGTGSTANFFIEELAKVKHKIDGAVASSEATAQRLRGHGIEVFDLNSVDGMDIYIGAAAISDYRPEAAPQKIKKRSDRLLLEMSKSPDLLATIAALPKPPFTVGFAAETERLEEYARQKLEGKRLDMIVANLVGARLGFDEDDNSAMVLWRNGAEELSRMSKLELARQIIRIVAARYRAARAPRVVSWYS